MTKKEAVEFNESMMSDMSKRLEFYKNEILQSIREEDMLADHNDQIKLQNMYENYQAMSEILKGAPK